MSNRSKWIGVTLVLLGIAIGSQYVRAAVGHHGLNSTTAATTTVSPEELTQAAGVLPVTLIDAYF